MKSFRKKGITGLLAVVLALLVGAIAMPQDALATPAPETNQPVKISGFEQGDKVYAYKVVDYNYATDDSNTYSVSYVEGLTVNLDSQPFSADQFNKLNPDDSEYGDTVKSVADQMASWVTKSQPAAADTDEADADGSVDLSLPLGEYIVLVTPQNSVVYQNILVKVEPKQDPETGDWSAQVTTPVITAKKENLTFTKTIDGESSTDKVASGDEVPFTIVASVPVYPSNYVKNFEITDTMQGLTFSQDQLNGMQVTIQTAGGEKVDGGYYETKLTGNGFTFNLTESGFTNLAGKTIVLSYKATVSNKNHGQVASNDASLKYNNGPTTTTTAESHTDVYNYQLKVLKTDDSSNPNPLSGARFEVYNNESATGSPIATIETDSTGVATVEGLAAGTYYLKEVAAPTGYQLDSTINSVAVDGENDGTGDNAYIVSKTIVNKKSPTLPITGGSGTIALTAAGVVLVAGAAALIVRTRRNNE